MSAVYALVDPRDGLPHYVGASRRLRRRMQAHRNGLQRGDGKYWIGAWLSELRDAGLTFREQVLEESRPETLGDVEAFWIAQGRGLGWPLTNETSGGWGAPGLKHSASARRVMSRKARARPSPVGFTQAGRAWSSARRAKLMPSRERQRVPLVDDLGRRYVSVRAAARSLGVEPCSISKHLSGHTKTVAGRILQRAP